MNERQLGGSFEHRKPFARQRPAVKGDTEQREKRLEQRDEQRLKKVTFCFYVVDTYDMYLIPIYSDFIRSSNRVCGSLLNPLWSFLY